MKFYGIRNKKTKEPLGISIFSNGDAEFCNSCGALFETSNFYSNLYIVRTEQIALKSLEKDPDWYNACLENPEWPPLFYPEEYEVFSVDIF